MFLKPLMLAGLGAAVIPLVLHLLSKARYRSVEWGAMMFLTAGPMHAQRSTRLKQLLLLLLRVCMIATLTIALARPVIRARAAASAEDARIHAIIILDRSASMGYVEQSRTRLAEAKQAVINILSNLHRGDEVSLILTGDPVDPGQAQPTTDLQSVAARVGALVPSYGRANIAAALEQARQAMLREPGVTHELYIVSDQQASSWERVNDRFVTLWQSTQAQLNASLRTFAIPVGGAEADNVAIESIELPGPPLIRDIAGKVELRLRNFGPIPRSDLPVRIFANGKQVAQMTTNLAPDSSSMATAWLKFPASGSQVLSARLTSSGLRSDDRIDCAVEVLEPVRVLIITGETRSADRRSSADYLRLALAPFEASGEAGVDPAVVRIIGVDDWWGISPDRDDVIILSNVGPLSDDQVRQLEQFCYAGGAIVFAPGNLTDVESCNTDLYREGEGFLPAGIKSTINVTAHVAQADNSHPVFDFLQDRAGGLPDAPVTKILDLEDRSSDARVLASFAGNKPFLIERPFGRGRVLMFTTTLGTDWNALPTSSIYLPMMQSAIRYLAGINLPQRNLKPGEPIELSFDHEPAETAATVTLPNGQQRRARVNQSGQRWTMRFGETNLPGRYLLAFPNGKPSNYVVQAPRDESDPTPVSTERWAWLQNALNFKWLNPEKDALANAVTSERTGKELHLPLLGLVALLALGEMALARMWSRQS